MNRYENGSETVFVNIKEIYRSVMKKFDVKKFLGHVGTIVFALAVFEIGKKQLDRIKTTPPAVKEEEEI